MFPQVSGFLTKVCIQEGARVRQGQVLFIIDQVPYKAALATAEANVENAKVAVATAQMNADSRQALYDEKVVSDFDLQSAKNELLQSKAALALAEAELLNARNNLSYTEVKSPVNGSAGMISYRVGASVSTSMTTPLVTVSDNDEMYAYFSLSETGFMDMAAHEGSPDAVKSSMDTVTLQLSNGTMYDLSGKVDAISGIVDPSTGSISVRAVFPNPEHLLMSGSAGKIFIPYEYDDCIIIPQAATFELQDKIFVYKVVDGKTKSTNITVNPVNDGTEYIVESGLEEGDVIISDGAGLLRDGLEVTVQ